VVGGEGGWFVVCEGERRVGKGQEKKKEEEKEQEVIKS